MASAGKAKRRKTGGPKKARACPECGSVKVVSILYGEPTAEARKAVERGRAVLSDCEEWEGRPQWHCKACGCEWRGEWKRFKRSAEVST